MNFQFQVHMTCLSRSQMGQSLMVTRLALEQPVRVQFEILLNQGLYFEYTQLLPGAVSIKLILPPFGKDKTRLANIDFTQFFCQKAPFLDFWNQIYKAWGFQKYSTCTWKVLRKVLTWCLFDKKVSTLNK